MTFTTSALVLSWVAIALLGFALAGVLGRVHHLERTVAGPTPEPTRARGPLSLPDVEHGPLLALFVDRGCGSCEKAVDGVDDLVERGLATVYWRDEDPEVFHAVDVPMSPFAIVADADLAVVTAMPVGNARRLDEAVAALTELEVSAPA